MTNPTNAQCHRGRLRSDCAQSDQSSLCAQCVAKNPRFLHADSKDSDQTGRMLRQILVFAGRICNFVGFVQHHSRHKLGSEHEQQLRHLGV